MATITAPTQLRHARKTITFDGGAGNGLVDDPVTLFATTGRVLLAYMTAFVSESCAYDACDTIQIGVESSPFAFYRYSGDAPTVGQWLTKEDDAGAPKVRTGYGTSLLPEQPGVVEGGAPFSSAPVSEDIVLTPEFVD